MSNKRNISVIGLGYVGLPVAVAFGQQAKVVGFDINQERIAALKNGIDHTNMTTPAELQASDIHYSTDPKALASADFHIVAVPTPVDNKKQPDLTPVLMASQTIGQILKPGDIVVYESTVYPGATEEECLTVLEKESGLIGGDDFFIGYSPERINPGDKRYTFTKIKKIVSAQDEKTLAIIAKVYESVVAAGVYIAPSIKVAEAAKVIENTQRDVNIALMNELAVLCKKMAIDTDEVLEAAKTKWNFLPFEPGLVGGHCISVDPYYLIHKAKSLDYTPEVIVASRKRNNSMPEYIAQSVIKQLQKINQPVATSVITILGITYKENVADIGNTSIVDLITALSGATVQVCDPYADGDEVKTACHIDLIALKALKKADVVIFAIAHEQFVAAGWPLMVQLLKTAKGIVYDVKNKLDNHAVPNHIQLIRL